MADYSIVGKPVDRRDAVQKVTGRALHVGNMEPPGLLQVAVLRSPHPHAHIVRIDKSRAEVHPGVVAVLTGADIAAMPGITPYHGPAFADQPVLAIDRVRHEGEQVVAVAAENRRAAEEALELVEVEYEPLPVVRDVLDAIKPDAPIVHDEIRPSGAFADLAHVKAGDRSNICYHYKLRKGDVDKAFVEADRIFEDVFTAPPAQHVPMEPHVSLAYVDEGGRINIHTASQSPSFVRGELARMLGVPMNRIRVRVPYLGGGYGAKLYNKLEPIVAILAMRTGRPVKYSLSREEEFQTVTKHGVVVKLKTAVKGSAMTARKCEVYWDTGAFAEIGPRIVHKSGYTSSGPYKIPNVSIDSYCVYTNKPPAGPFRGFGVPQVIWAYDSQMDIVARGLGADPVEFRLEHALEEGDLFVTGTPVHACGLKEAVRRAADAVGWDSTAAAPGNEPPLPEEAQQTTEAAGTEQPGKTVSGTKRRGKGIACGVKAVLTPSISGAIVILNADGSANVLSSTVEMGQGSESLLSQIAAEELGISFDKVHVVQPDTDVTPYDTISAGSRSTYHMGNAVRTAAANVKAELFEAVAGKLEIDAADLEARDGRVFVRGAEELGMTVAEAFMAKFGSLGTTMVGEGLCQPVVTPTDPETGLSDKCTEYWFASASAVEVEVDLETGRLEVLQFHAAGDAGTAINPKYCEQQLVGAATMHLGLTLFEQMVFQDGQLLNGSLLDYQIASIKDVPAACHPIVVQVPHKDGPFGAKGIGETGALTVAAAVANALEDAVGVRLRDIPLTAERIHQALKAAGK
ncbi:MAG: molybdopterin-dependent oxidoreductase [Deltaproteobacteria bacterium]|nr:molybdopterin-dependent oxidoreductase [Deltaproteobacteria bacterium]